MNKRRITAEKLMRLAMTDEEWARRQEKIRRLRQYGQWMSTDFDSALQFAESRGVVVEDDLLVFESKPKQAKKKEIIQNSAVASPSDAQIANCGRMPDSVIDYINNISFSEDIERLALSNPYGRVLPTKEWNENQFQYTH